MSVTIAFTADAVRGVDREQGVWGITADRPRAVPPGGTRFQLEPTGARTGRWCAVAALVYVPHARLFVDESKAKGYYISVAAVAPADVVGTDRSIRQLSRHGQRRIHFKSEKDSSRRQLLSQFGALGVKVVVYATKGLSDKDARAR